MKNENPKGLKKYLEYSKERFPIPGVLIYAGTLFYVSYHFVSLFSQAHPVDWAGSIGGFIVFFLIILHLRIFDEHKDYYSDIIAHPERMLSRGVITLAELRKLLAFVIVIELAISVYSGTQQFVLWTVILIWSVLMFYEFFAPEFLKKHTGVYLISHQLLVPVMVFYAVSFRLDITALQVYDIKYILLFAAAVMCATITYEISRKTWSEDLEHELADSYTKTWGIKPAVFINQAVALCGGLIMIYLYSIFGAGIAYSAVLTLLFLILFSTGMLFIKKPSARNSKLVEAGGMVYMLGLFINSIVFFN